MSDHLMRAMIFRFVQGPDEARKRARHYMAHSASIYACLFGLSFLLPVLNEARYACLALALYSFADVGRYPQSLFGSALGDAATIFVIAARLASDMLAAGVDAGPVGITCAVLALGALWRMLVATNLYVQVRRGFGFEI